MSPTPPSPRTPDESFEQGSPVSRRRSHKKDQDRHSTSRDVLKMLISEEHDSKQSRRFMRTAFARLNSESQRAQEAERRALELAARFKVVNETRLTTQQELNRANEELRLYKVHYENARREIMRGQEMLKALEEQRDDAEAVAARARTETRKLREEKLMYRAREEGRLAGYKEGFDRGLEQARYESVRDGSEAGIRDEDDGFLEDLPSGLPSSRTEEEVPLASPIPRHPIPPLDQPGMPSRFHEHGVGLTPGPSNANLPSGDGWPQETENVKYVRPPSIVEAPSMQNERHIPPDNYIPVRDPDGVTRLPPAHEFSEPLTPRGSNAPLSGYTQRRPSTEPPRRYADSLDSANSGHSTNMSQFDLVSQPPEPGRLSVIREASFELSPEDGHNAMPDPIVFPTAPGDRDGGWPEAHEPEGMRTPRSQHANQRIADELRYGDPSIPEQWRKSARNGSEMVSVFLFAWVSSR